MDGDVRRIGDQRALAVEQGAGEIEPLLDVDGGGRVLERDPHFLGDCHEEVVEHLERHRIDGSAGGVGAVAGPAAGEDEVAEPIHFGLPAGFDDGGGGGVDNEGRASDQSAGGKGGAVVDFILPARSGGRGTRGSLVEG
jgi:hypothetical protein